MNNNIVSLETALPCIKAMVKAAADEIEYISKTPCAAIDVLEELSDAEWLFLSDNAGVDCVDMDALTRQLNRIIERTIDFNRKEKESNE